MFSLLLLSLFYPCLSFSSSFLLRLFHYLSPPSISLLLLFYSLLFPFFALCFLLISPLEIDNVAEWSKACDSKSLLLWRRRFKSCRCRSFCSFLILSLTISFLYSHCSHLSHTFPFTVSCLFTLLMEARVAEWSKALVSGTSLFGGVGSNPTSCILPFIYTFLLLIIINTFLFLSLFSLLYLFFVLIL